MEKEEDIWLNIQSKELLLSSFKNYYNVFRISANNCRILFDVTLKDNSLLSFENEGILVITNIGALVFEKDGEITF